MTHCTYPDCNCPFDAPADPNWCARGLPKSLEKIAERHLRQYLYLFGLKGLLADPAILDHIPAVKALREENELLEAVLLQRSGEIQRLESRLAELRQGGEAVGEVVLESIGVPGSDAQIVRFHMYKEIPPVGTKLYTRPQPAIPPGYVVVPEADPHYLAARILATLGIAQEVSKEPGADRRRDKIAEMIEECFNTADGGRVRHSISMPEGLHPDTAKLVKRFARALANKLHAAEKKYGYDNGWMRPDWMDECREHLMLHIAKGDPRDVAAYCAFLWHHDASTASAPAIQPQAAATMAEQTDGAETAWSIAGRLALELECLLLDTKDTAIVSKWWDTAHEALEDYRLVRNAAPCDCGQFIFDRCQALKEKNPNIGCKADIQFRYKSPSSPKDCTK